MKLSKNNFWGFDWLVRTSPVKLVLLMVFIPFLFFLWLFKIGQLSERKLSLKPDYLFRSLLVVFLLGMILIFSSFFWGGHFNLDKYYNYVFFPIYLCFIYIDFYGSTTNLMEATIANLYNSLIFNNLHVNACNININDLIY